MAGSQSTISAEQLLKFLSLQEKLDVISEETAYLEKLLELARRKLSLRDLERYGEHLAKIRKKLDNLNISREKLLYDIRDVMPEYKKQSEIAKKLINFFFKLKEKVREEPETLNEIVSRIPEIREKAEKSYITIKEAIEQLQNILTSGEIKEEKYLKMIHEEITTLESQYLLLERIVNLLKITPEKLKKLWSMLGYFVVTEEPKTVLGVITGVVISKKSLKPMLEVSTENIVSESFLDELFKEVGADFKARSVEEFIDRLHDETKRMFGIETDITPTILERIFARADVTIPKDLRKELISEYKVSYYVDASAVKSERIDAKNLVLKVLKGEFKFSKEEDVDPLPSVTPLPKELILKEIDLGKYNYFIYSYTVLPKIGHVAIILRRDENGEPVPAIGFIRRILEILEKMRDSPIKLGEKKLSKMSDERLTWMLRIAVVRGIGSQYNVTEGNALKPRNLFQFFLTYRIPILYEDLVSAYFGVVPTANIVKINTFIDLKVKNDPSSIKKWLNENTLLSLFGSNSPGEIIGYTIQKKRGVAIKYLEKFNERKIYSFISEKFSIPEEVLRKHAKNNLKKLLMILIYQGKISNYDEYRALQEALGVKIIDYQSIIKKISNPETFVLYSLLSYL